MKKLALVFLFLAFNAQAFDLSIVGTANFESSRVSNLVGSVDASGKMGLGFGGLLDFEVGQTMVFETGALLINRKYQIGNIHSSFSRIQLPAMIRITALPIIHFGAGAYMEFSMGDVGVENATTGIKASSSYEFLNYDSTDFGVVASVGADIPVAPLMSMTVDLRYNLGLKDYDNSVAVTRKFSGLQILGGLKLSL